MFEDIFLRKKVVVGKLVSYGFRKAGDGYEYVTGVLGGAFELKITVRKGAAPYTELTEIATGEEYVLYKTDAVGAFVGEVRSAVADVLRDVALNCYETAIFKEKQTSELIGYVRDKYGDEPEYLWEKFPDNAVWRRKDNRKWYGAILTVSRRKLGLSSDEPAEILDLRGDLSAPGNPIDGKRYFPGWHMNKKHWYAVILDGSVPFGDVCRRIDESYLLADKKTSKRST